MKESLDRIIRRVLINEVKRITESEVVNIGVSEIDKKISAIRDMYYQRINDRDKVFFGGYDLVGKVLLKLTSKLLGTKYRDYNSLFDNPWETCENILRDVEGYDGELASRLHSDYLEEHWGEELYNEEELRHIRDVLCQQGKERQWDEFQSEYQSVIEYWIISEKYKEINHSVSSELLKEMVDEYISILSQWLRERKVNPKWYNLKTNDINRDAIADYLAEKLCDKIS